MPVPERFKIKGRRIRCEFISEKGRRCRHTAESVDHITPQAIGRLLGLTSQEINRRENLQRLCKRHHNAKDGDTRERTQVLQAQLSGELFVGLGQHDAAIGRFAEQNTRRYRQNHEHGNQRAS